MITQQSTLTLADVRQALPGISGRAIRRAAGLSETVPLPTRYRYAADQLATLTLPFPTPMTRDPPVWDVAALRAYRRTLAYLCATATPAFPASRADRQLLDAMRSEAWANTVEAAGQWHPQARRRIFTDRKPVPKRTEVPRRWTTEHPRPKQK